MECQVKFRPLSHRVQGHGSQPPRWPQDTLPSPESQLAQPHPTLDHRPLGEQRKTAK
jgi:hypothetical protein